MRSPLVRWGAAAYVLVSLTAIIWLSVANMSMRTSRARALDSQVTLLNNTLLGAIQNLDAVATPGSQDAARLLASAEASLAQAEIAALGYEKMTGHTTPLGSLAGDYAMRVRLIREDFGRTNTVSPEALKTLADIRADLDLIRNACQADVFKNGDQGAVTQLFATTVNILRMSHK